MSVHEHIKMAVKHLGINGGQVHLRETGGVGRPVTWVESLFIYDEKC